MMGRKKRILIITLSITLVLILIIGGVLIYLNTATDVFKDDDELFYKYLYQNSSIFNVVDTNLLDRYYQKIDNNIYTGNSELTIKTGNSDGSESDTKDFDDFINNLKLQSITKSNLPDKKQEIETKINYKDQEQFKFTIIRNGDNFGAKSDEIVNKYLVVKNENLRDIYNKIGIQNADRIPDQFTRINYNIYKNMNIEDKNRILATYQNLLNSAISKNHYSKQANVNLSSNGQTIVANAYSMTLTEHEIDSLKVSFLEKLMSDELTLKYIVQFMQLDTSYTVKIKQRIQEEIDNLKRNQRDGSENVVITVYESNKQLLTTTIETSEYLYSINNNISGDNQIVTITKNSKDGNNITETTTLTRNTSINKNTFCIDYIAKTGETATAKDTLTIELNGSLESNQIETTAKLENLDGNKTNEITYTNKKEFVENVEIEELNSENSVNVNGDNGMNIEDMNSIYKSIIERIQYLYGEKVRNLGLNIANINDQGTLKWSRIVDAFDEDEFKSQVQRALNLAKDDLQNKEEYRIQIEQASGNQNQINKIKGEITVARLRETGLNATLNEEDNAIAIMSNNESERKYEIDYDNFKISKLEE